MLAIVDLYRMIDKNAGGALDGVSQKPVPARCPRVLVRADGLTGQKPPEAGADDAEPHDRAPVTVVNKGRSITQSCRLSRGHFDIRGC
jgi:hypothetical protein